MKKIIKKYWVLIGMILAFVLDHSFDILKGLGLSDLITDLIKGMGMLVYGYFFTSKYNEKEVIDTISIK